MTSSPSMSKAALAVALAGLLGAVGAYLWVDRDAVPAGGGGGQDRVGALIPPIGPTNTPPVVATPSTPDVPRAAALKNPLAMGMTSANPLAFVTEMRAKGGPGGYAMADQVTYQCREALQALRAYGDPERTTLRATQQARNVGREGAALSAQSMAAQKIEARCRPFADDLESDTPKADDPYAKAYQDAIGSLLDGTHREASLKALAAQGQLSAALVALRGQYRPRGESAMSSEDQDLFARAMTVAAFNASADLQRQEDDLRVMTSCLNSTICDGTFESEYLSKWPVGSPQRQRAQRWIAQLQNAFASNDYSAFLPAPQRRGQP